MTDLTSTYEEFEELRDAVKDYWTSDDVESDMVAYAQGVYDTLGFLMVNKPSNIDASLVRRMFSTNAQLAEVFNYVVERSY